MNCEDEEADDDGTEDIFPVNFDWENSRVLEDRNLGNLEEQPASFGAR